MAVTSNRSVLISMTGDVEYSQTFAASVSSLGSGQISLIDLSSGTNTITVPTDAVAVTIIPPANNTQTMLLKKVTGDTGWNLALTAPNSISMDAVTTFVITAGGAITGVRFIFS